MRHPAFALLASLLAVLSSVPGVAEEVTPNSIVAAAPASAWKPIPDERLLVITLAGGKRVVIELSPLFAEGHRANIIALAKAHWWDGQSIYRVQDNYVAQWGDSSGKTPLPAGVTPKVPRDYDRPLFAERKIVPLGSPDPYARSVGFIDGWPVGSDGQRVWPTHCYGAVGVGRDLAPDTGTGAELYAIIGHAPRQLDRNIALVGRVIDGMENLASLPRGTGEMGFAEKDAQRTPILSVRLASELPAANRLHYEWLDTGSLAFADYVKVRANRRDSFYDVPAGGVDICNVPVPIRARKGTS